MKELESSSESGRQLGIWMCLALVVGNMIGSGIFLLPAKLGDYHRWRDVPCRRVFGLGESDAGSRWALRLCGGSNGPAAGIPGHVELLDIDLGHQFGHRYRSLRSGWRGVHRCERRRHERLDLADLALVGEVASA